ALDAIGRLLVKSLGLRGLFGVDFVLEGGRPWVVEVNPRYTASVEILELAGHRSFLREHAAAFDRDCSGVAHGVYSRVFEPGWPGQSPRARDGRPTAPGHEDFAPATREAPHPEEETWEPYHIGHPRQFVGKRVIWADRTFRVEPALPWRPASGAFD